MRLRWGPHASQLTEQVVISDPLYVLSELSDHPAGALAGMFRDLILELDGRAFTAGCARCGRTATGVCAYPGSVELIGFCTGCVWLSDRARPSPAVRIDTYEDALRHVATSFRRGHRIQMRRIAKGLVAAKGGPLILTEAALLAFFRPGGPSRLGRAVQAIGRPVGETSCALTGHSAGRPARG